MDVFVVLRLHLEVWLLLKGVLLFAIRYFAGSFVVGVDGFTCFGGKWMASVGVRLKWMYLSSPSRVSHGNDVE